MNTTKQRLDKIEDKVDDALERNTQAFIKLSDTMESVKIAMIDLAESVIESQRSMFELKYAVGELTEKVNKIEQKLS